jgi:ELWxxDGT repeat protein
LGNGRDGGGDERINGRRRFVILCPLWITDVGTKAVFAATDSNGNNALWVTDGTAAGTSEISTVSVDSTFTALGNKLLFNGNGGLWVTDGTAAGTSELTVAGAASSGLGPFGGALIFPDPVFGNEVLFAGLDASGNGGLWKTDGTSAGTSEVMSGVDPYAFAVLGNKELFIDLANPGEANNENLWVTDGTSAGTSELMAGGVNITGGLTTVGNQVLFTALDANGNEGLWTTDGTLAGTTEVSAAGPIAEAIAAFTLPVGPVVTLHLSDDTGISSSDKITDDPALRGSGKANTVVTLTEGTTVLGTATSDASGAWSFTPTGLADGIHTIVASETDAAGNTGSAALIFTLDTTPPIITERLAHDTGSSPSDGITSNPALSGSGEANAVVTLMEGSTVLGTTTAAANGHWNFSPVGLADGVHTIVASEPDVAGNIGSTSLTFTLDTTPPAVALSLSDDTGISSSDQITSDPTLTGSGEANAVVTLKQGTTVLGTTTADGSGAWSFTPVGLTDGVHNITASETDAAGNTGKATLKFTLETTPPVTTESLAHDTGSSSTDGITSNPALSGTGVANAVVTLMEGSTVLGTVTASGNGHWTFSPTGLADGSHTILASEVDPAGNAGPTTSFSFTLDTTPPAVTLALSDDTGSSPGDKITSDPALSGSGDANAVVTLKEGTTVLGTTTADGSGAWLFTPVGLTDGVHTIVASETDVAGNTGKATLKFTLDTTPPAAPVFTQDLPGLNQTTLKGTSEPHSTVSVYDGSNLVGSAVSNNTGTWNLVLSDLSNTVHDFSAFATDVAGNRGPSAVPALLGSSGADTLYGGLGANLLTGNGGQDIFLYTAASDSTPAAYDTITDFSAALDKIDLSAISGLTIQGQITATSAVLPNSIAWLNGSNTEIFVNTSGQSEAQGSTDMQILLKGNIALSSNNFLG